MDVSSVEVIESLPPEYDENAGFFDKLKVTANGVDGGVNEIKELMKPYNWVALPDKILIQSELDRIGSKIASLSATCHQMEQSAVQFSSSISTVLAGLTEQYNKHNQFMTDLENNLKQHGYQPLEALHNTTGSQMDQSEIGNFMSNPQLSNMEDFSLGEQASDFTEELFKSRKARSTLGSKLNSPGVNFSVTPLDGGFMNSSPKFELASFKMSGEPHEGTDSGDPGFTTEKPRQTPSPFRHTGFFPSPTMFENKATTFDAKENVERENLTDNTFGRKKSDTPGRKQPPIRIPINGGLAGTPVVNKTRPANVTPFRIPIPAKSPRSMTPLRIPVGAKTNPKLIDYKSDVRVPGVLIKSSSVTALESPEAPSSPEELTNFLKGLRVKPPAAKKDGPLQITPEDPVLSDDVKVTMQKLQAHSVISPDELPDMTSVLQSLRKGASSVTTILQSENMVSAPEGTFKVTKIMDLQIPQTPPSPVFEGKFPWEK